tara:strand:- start:233 stop:418 length:186 start_codon:yes stop_codon:yes gene_type:complete
MKSINLELILPEPMVARDLRMFILSKIIKKGELIRWSIYEITNLKNNFNQKIIKVNALILK